MSTQIREDHDRHAEIVEASNDVILYFDPDGLIRYMNAAGRAIFDVFPGARLADLLPGWAARKVQDEGIPAAILKGTWQGDSAFIVREQERPAWQQILAHRDEAGRCLYLTTVLRDVTGQRELERRYRESEEKLRAERDFLTAVRDIAGCLICVLDARGRFVSFNKACERLSGWTEDEAIGRDPCEFLVPVEQHDIVWSVVSSIEAGLYPNDNENEWILRSGERRLIKWCNTAILDDQGQVKYVIATGIDIHQQRQAERALQESERRLDEQVRLLKDARTQLVSRQRELMAANESLKSLAETDGLTGVKNKRYLMERLESEIARATRFDYPISLVILDLDHFKGFNDRYGHLDGDEVLRVLGGVLAHESRQGDLAARYGGEEFVLLLPHIGIRQARAAAERVRLAIESQTWPHGAPITASLGVATVDRDPLTSMQLLAEADRALYAAKAAGRNCVLHAEDIRVELTVSA